MAAESQQAPEGLVSNARIESLESSISSIQDTLRSMATAHKEASGSPSPGMSSTPDQPAGQAAVPVAPSFLRAQTSNQPASPAIVPIHQSLDCSLRRHQRPHGSKALLVCPLTFGKKMENENGRASGYIHSLSPVKRSRKNNYYYDFALQVSPTKVRRVVGFNADAHATSQQAQTSKHAVELKNVKESDTNDALIFNQLSTVQLQPTSGISFDYKGTDSFSIDTAAPIQAMEITTSKTLTIKEDCVLEDKTGTAELHIWEPLFHELIDGRHTYKFKNLSVKIFKESCPLATRQDTSFCDAEQELTDAIGHKLLNNPEQELEVKHFLLIRNLCVFLSCQHCSKKITAMNSQKVKCSYCKTCQRANECKTHACALIKVKDAGNSDIWLTAFTDVLEELLAVSHTVSLASNIDVIEDVLLGLVNIKFVYNVSKHAFVKVLDVSRE
eukprot:gene1445-1590_t